MGDLLALLDPDDRRELLSDLNYLNLSEIRTFCRRHGIPARIMVQSPDGTWKSTSDPDRKPVILERVRSFLETGDVPEPTRLPARIVRHTPPPDHLKPTDRIYYRLYNKIYRPVIDLLTELTDGRLRDGALARALINEFWTKGEAPTFDEAWIAATENGRDLTFRRVRLLDRSEGGTGRCRLEGDQEPEGEPGHRNTRRAGAAPGSVAWDV